MYDLPRTLLVTYPFLPYGSYFTLIDCRMRSTRLQRESPCVIFSLPPRQRRGGRKAAGPSYPAPCVQLVVLDHMELLGSLTIFAGRSHFPASLPKNLSGLYDDNLTILGCQLSSGRARLVTVILSTRRRHLHRCLVQEIGDRPLCLMGRRNSARGT